MNVLRHDYVPQNHQPIPPSHSLKNSQQQVPPSLATEQALTPIATERDEMQITRAIEVEALSGRQSPLPKSRAKPRDPSTKLRRKLSVMVEHGRSSTTPRVSQTQRDPGHPAQHWRHIRQRHIHLLFQHRADEYVYVHRGLYAKVDRRHSDVESKRQLATIGDHGWIQCCWDTNLYLRFVVSDGV